MLYEDFFFLLNFLLNFCALFVFMIAYFSICALKIKKVSKGKTKEERLSYSKWIISQSETWDRMNQNCVDTEQTTWQINYLKYLDC